MGETTAIEWTGSTWGPWRGCLKVSQGCKNCYMYRDQAGYGLDPTKIVRASEKTFNAPLKWIEPRKVFVCSWSDFFLPQADEWRDEAWSIIRKTPHLTYQIPTKRPGYIETRLPKDWGEGYPNVWLGVSVENQDNLQRAYMLAAVPAAVRFISYEPALGPVDFTQVLPKFKWLISGGESDFVSPRDAKTEWFLSARDQCASFGVAYFHKQNGGKVKIFGSYGGNLLDGHVYQAFPDTGPAALRPGHQANLF